MSSDSVVAAGPTDGVGHSVAAGPPPDCAYRSVVAEPPELDQTSYFQAPSHTADEIDSELMEAGDLPFEVGFEDLSIVFKDTDWRQHKTTLMAGKWAAKIDGPVEKKPLVLKISILG